MGNRCTWWVRKVRAGAVPTSIVAGWLVFAMMLVWLFESHALLPRSGFSDTFGTWSAESFNFSDRVWRAALEGSPRASGDDALVATLAELEDGDGVVVVGDYEDNHTALVEAVEQAQARLEEAEEPAAAGGAGGGGGGSASESQSGAALDPATTVEMTAADGSVVRVRPLKRHPKYGTNVDTQVAVDLAPWRVRGGGITLADVWLTKHNVTPNAGGNLPRWVPEAVAGHVAYGALFNSSGGIMGRYVRPRYWGRKPAVRRNKGGGKGGKGSSGKGRQLLEQPQDGGDGSADDASASSRASPKDAGAAVGSGGGDDAAATTGGGDTRAEAGSSSGGGGDAAAKVDPAVAAADAAEAAAYGPAASLPPWSGQEPNPYDGMENQHGRPLGVFEMWIIDGVPYFALEDAVSSESAFYWGQLYKINAAWGLLRSSLVEAQRGVLRAQKDKGHGYARALGVPSPADAAQWTAGVVPDVYALINVEPVPLLPRKPEAEAPAGGGGGKGAAAAAVAGAPVAPRGMAPVLSLCKTDGHWDVLYPNMYFVSPAFWEAQVAKIRDNNRLRPWATRKNLVWWRGSAGYNWPGIAPRLHTLARYYSRKWADLAFTDNWGAVFAIWRRKWRGGVFRARIPAHAYKIRAGKPLSMRMEEVSGYKYTLHLPGYYHGTYSRMLQFLMWTGSVVFKLENDYYEFYYRHMKPWVHYVPVTVSSLETRVRRIMRDGATAQAIVAAAGELAKTRLSPQALVGYWTGLLHEYARMQTFDVRGGAATRGRALCTCWAEGQATNSTAAQADAAAQAAAAAEASAAAKAAGGDAAAAAAAAAAAVPPGTEWWTRHPPGWVTVPGAVYCGTICSVRRIVHDRSLRPTQVGPILPGWRGYVGLPGEGGVPVDDGGGGDGASTDAGDGRRGRRKGRRRGGG